MQVPAWNSGLQGSRGRSGLGFEMERRREKTDQALWRKEQTETPSRHFTPSCTPPNCVAASIPRCTLGEEGENKDPRGAEGDTLSLLLSFAVSLKLL